MWRLNIGRLTLAMLLTFSLCLALNAQNTTVNSDDWVVISSSKEASPGTPFEVQVDIRKLNGKTQLSLDLHWMRKDGTYGGFLARRSVSPSI
jgi:hypothetical protein